jgi:hypothetical protein
MEVLTRQVPYTDILSMEFASKWQEHTSGATNHFPADTDPALLALLKPCLAIESDDRPSFADICDGFDEKFPDVQ